MTRYSPTVTLVTVPAYGSRSSPNAFTILKPAEPIGGSPLRGGSSGKRLRGFEMARALISTLTKPAASAMPASTVFTAARFSGPTCAISRWTVRGTGAVPGTPPGAPGMTPRPPSESEPDDSDDAVDDAGHGCSGPDNATGDRWSASTRLRRDAPRGSGSGGAPAAPASGAAWTPGSPRPPALGESGGSPAPNGSASPWPGGAPDPPAGARPLASTMRRAAAMPSGSIASRDIDGGDDRERRPLDPARARPRERAAARTTTGLREATG